MNIIFTFSGIVLHTFAIASIWKSSQLRKKLCHFMIMVLSCFDLVTVLTNHPGILVYLIFWLRENYYLLPKIRINLNIFSVHLIFSPFALLVTSIERYLGAYFPVFHHTSVIRRRLLTLLGIVLIPIAVLYIISRNGLVISISANLLIVMVLFFRHLYLSTLN